MRMLSIAVRVLLQVSVSLLVARASAHAFDNTSVGRAATCTSTVYANAQPIALGTINLLADGQGNYVAGIARYTLAGGSGLGCNYVMTGGSYLVNPDGSGFSATNWRLDNSVSSSPRCASTVSGSSGSFSITNNTFSVSFPNNHTEIGTCTTQ